MLTRQVEELTDGAISANMMKTSLSLGVAVSVGLDMIRVLTGISIFYLLIPGYTVAIMLSFLVPKMFTAIAFDSGGVTTGPITVPFIMALGIGVASTHSDGQKAEDNSFGMVALCSIGPILAVLIMGICLRGTEISYTPSPSPTPTPPGRPAPRFCTASPSICRRWPWACCPWWCSSRCSKSFPCI